MALTGSLQFSPLLGLCRNRERSKHKHLKYVSGRCNRDLLAPALSSCASRQDMWSSHLSASVSRPLCSLPHRNNVVRCHSILDLSHSVVPAVKSATIALTRSCNALQGNPIATNLVQAVGIIVFALWGLGPLMRLSRSIILHKSDNSWKKSTTNYVMTSYFRPILLWTGAYLICRALDPVTMPTEPSQLVKQRLLNFVKSLSTVLAFAFCLSSVIQQGQKYFMESNDPADTRNMGFQFAGKAVYSAVWVAAVSLFMELLGFSTQKWLTAGGLGTVLLTLAGREIFTNFLSSAMIHATRPFVVNEWIQTKIEGYEVSGTVEHVGWWSPTIIRGEDREAVHIPNHKFTMNVVRNLSQKTHWRIKTHLAISHLDVGKINTIVADMRKVLAKNPQVEQQKLHRRVFLENVNPENQALMILISCFVKTSHHEEFLCVKEAIILDLLRVISHHRARLATPIRTIQKFHREAEMESMPFSETIFGRGGPASKRPIIMIEPSYKINGEDKSKSKTDSKVKGTSVPEVNIKETIKSENKAEGKVAETSNSESREEDKVTAASISDMKADEKATVSGKVSKSSGNVQSKGSVETHVEKLPASEPVKATAALEENIVLGVALEGSKRTLPIEEELDSPPTSAETKEFAARSNGNVNGNSGSDKDEREK